MIEASLDFKEDTGGTPRRFENAVRTFASYFGNQDVAGTGPEAGEIRQDAAAASDPSVRLKKRIPVAVARAKELEAEFGDPLEELISFMNSLPGDYDTWRQIVDEPS